MVKGKISTFSEQLQRSPVVLVAFIDVVFLIVLVYLFKTNCPDELRTVIKNAFLGWNGALALSINVVNTNSHKEDNPDHELEQGEKPPSKKI